MSVLLLRSATEYFTIPYHASLAASTSGPLAMSAWVNLTDIPSGTDRYHIMAKGYLTTTTNTPYEFEIDGNSGTPRVRVGSFGPAVYGASWNLSGISAGEWHHYFGMYYSGDWYIYVDGDLKAQNTDTGPRSNTSNNSIGNVLFNNASGGHCMNGQIEDPRILLRYVSPKEIALLAAGYRGVLGGEVAWHSFSGALGVSGGFGGASLATGNTMPDLSVNENIATPVATPTGQASEAPRFGCLIR